MTLPDKPYASPINCTTCHKQHSHKTYHLELDGNGGVIVSEQIYEALQSVALGGLELANQVKKPPAQIIGFTGTPNGHRPVDTYDSGHSDPKLN